MNSNDSNYAMFELADEESGDVLLSGEDISGFFVGNEDIDDPVTVHNIHELHIKKRIYDGTELHIRGRKSGIIGTYTIGRIVLSGVELAAAKIGSPISFEFFGNRGDYPGAAAIWRQRAAGMDLSYGEWTRLVEVDLMGWLEVALKMWCIADRDGERPRADSVVRLDATLFSSRAGFYCALGEAVNGPGGYFGWNLDALTDCLRLARRGNPVDTLIWSDFSRSQACLDESFLAEVTNILQENSVELVEA